MADSNPAFSPPSEASTRLYLDGLLAWYQREQRDLPWRRVRDPYAIWVSEAMLQQTRVEAVKEYWRRFLERFPTNASLAGAHEEHVLEAWSGLGYYRRARSLQSAAQVIEAEHGGEFPRSHEDALALPGVGPYTAGAVLSIAYDEAVPIVDGNVERVFARWFAVDEARGSGPLTRFAWAAAAHFIDAGQGLLGSEFSPGAWNQGLMELGAVVCTPKAPSCLLCPVADRCAARAAGVAESLPRPKPVKAAVDVALEIYVVERDGQFLVERRPRGGRMAGLWELPTVETTETGLFPEDVSVALRNRIEPDEDAFSISHSITNHRIRARVRRATAPGLELVDGADGLAWVDDEAALELALTGMAKKVVRALSKG